MASERLETLTGSAHFDYDDLDAVQASIETALGQLLKAATTTSGEVVWSSVSIHFDVQTVSDQKMTDEFPRLRAGLSTVTATAQAIVPAVVAA